MAMRLSALQVNGDMIHFEVTPEMTGRELKWQIRAEQFPDEVTRSTTVVEIIVGDRLLGNDETLADAGIAANTVVSVVFKPNILRCSNKGDIASCREMDSELQVIAEIPSDKTTVSAWAFAECKQLATVTIPDSVTHIGNCAFAHCTSLANLTIPNSVTHIGTGAFMGCSSLANLTIPNSVTHIENVAFANCSSVANLTIPNSVTHIGKGCLSGLQLCDKLDHPGLGDAHWN